MGVYHVSTVKNRREGAAGRIYLRARHGADARVHERRHAGRHQGSAERGSPRNQYSLHIS